MHSVAAAHKGSGIRKLAVPHIPSFGKPLWPRPAPLRLRTRNCRHIILNSLTLAARRPLVGEDRQALKSCKQECQKASVGVLVGTSFFSPWSSSRSVRQMQPLNGLVTGEYLIHSTSSSSSSSSSQRYKRQRSWPRRSSMHHLFDLVRSSSV